MAERCHAAKARCNLIADFAPGQRPAMVVPLPAAQSNERLKPAGQPCIICGTTLIYLVVVLAVGISALGQIFTDPRITRAFIWKSLMVLAIYFVQVAIGMFILIFLLPWNRNAAGAAAVALVGWVALGGLGLLRVAPRTREPPQWLMHFGIADVVCLLAVAWGLSDYAGLL